MNGLMPKILTDITQAQYNQLGTQYIDKIYHDDLFYFVNRIEGALLQALSAKFGPLGYEIKKRNFPEDFMIYIVEKIETGKQEIFSTKLIDISSAVKQILCLDLAFLHS